MPDLDQLLKERTLTKSSDSFSAAMVAFVDTETNYIDYLRNRQRWYLGVKQSTVPGEVPDLETKDKEECPEPVEKKVKKKRKKKKSKVRQPVPVKTREKEKEKGLSKLQVAGLIAGVGLIVGGIALALADGPLPGPADAAAIPVIAKGVNKIVPFVRALTGAGAKVAVPAAKSAVPAAAKSSGTSLGANSIKHFTRPGVKVPSFGKGGIITKPTHALIGESGPELVLPLSKLGDAIGLVYKEGARAMIATTRSFLGVLPPSSSRSGLLSKINALASTFGIGEETKGSWGGRFGLVDPLEWWNRGRDERVANENEAPWSELWEDDNAQKGMSDEAFAAGKKAPWLGRPDQAFNPFRKREKGGPGSGPTPMVRQVFERPARAFGRAFGIGGPPEGGASDAKIAPPKENGIDMSGQKIHLNPEASRAWQRASRDAANDGVDLAGGVNSSYRSPAQQAELLQREQAGDPSVIDPAPVGESPHGHGQALDVNLNSIANQWLINNGGKYGFKWSGPADPVHFNFMSNTNPKKWLEPAKRFWKPQALEGTRNFAKGAMNLGKEAFQRTSGFISGLMKGVGGLAKLGDGQSVSPAMSAPPPSSASQSVVSTPVNQSSRSSGSSGGTIVPMVIPIPQGSTNIPTQSEDTEVKFTRNVIIDTFSKGVKVEVYRG